MNEAQLKNFHIVSNFRGFENKRDITKVQEGIAVSGSQNCIIVDGEKIGNRPGFTHLGARSTDRYGILGSDCWKTSSNTQIPWRSFYNGSNGVFQFYYATDGTWETVDSSLLTGKVRHALWWSTTEVQDLMVLVCGSDKLYNWSGGVATYASATANTITKSGSTTWAEERFLTAGTRKVRIKDSGGTWREFTYTGGESTTTLTGVTPDPTAYTFTVGALSVQSLVETDNKPADGLVNDFVAVYLNYLFVFDEERRVVQMSKSTDYTDFSAPASPRLPATAGTFTLDEFPTAAITQPDGDALYISTKNQWYQIVFTPSADLTTEAITVKPLKTSPLEGATNSLAVTNMKNMSVYVSGEPTVDQLGRVESIDTPQSIPLSDPIKNTMDVAGTTTSAVGYYKNNFYVAVKNSSSDGANNRLLVRNLANGYWETPWTIPCSSLFEYNGELYVNDPSTTNTYKILDDYSDGKTASADGAPIVSKWYSGHNNFGAPFNQKTFNTFWIDGYIRANTTLDLILSFDFGTETKKYSISGLDDDIIIAPSSVGGGLGYYSLGTRNLGGRGETLSATGLKRFRGFVPMPERPFYELQVSFQSAGVGQRWEVVEYGMNLSIINGQNNNLRI